MKTLLQPKRLQKSVLQRLTLFLWPLKFMPIFQTWFLESIYVSIKFYPFSTKMVKISIIFQTKTAQKPILFGAATYIAYVGKYSFPNPPPPLQPRFLPKAVIDKYVKEINNENFFTSIKAWKSVHSCRFWYSFQHQLPCHIIYLYINGQKEDFQALIPPDNQLIFHSVYSPSIIHVKIEVHIWRQNDKSRFRSIKKAAGCLSTKNQFP